MPMDTMFPDDHWRRIIAQGMEQTRETRKMEEEKRKEKRRIEASLPPVYQQRNWRLNSMRSRFNVYEMNIANMESS